MPAPPASHSPAILVEQNDAIGRITLNRPPLNILDLKTLSELNDALRRLASSGCRVVMIRSDLPECFSAGVDIRDHAQGSLPAMLAEVRENARLLLTIEAVTVAVIHGSTLGGGAELALLCDLVIAGEATTLRLPEIGLAAFPPVAVSLFPERFPWPAAMRLLLGEPMTALDARDAGLIAEVIPAAALRPIADERATQLAALSGIALRALVRATRIDGAGVVLDRLDSAIGTYIQLIGPSRDAQEGIDAFLQKRTPVWSHR